MNRSCLFMAGEFRVSMPAVFARDRWQHTMVAKPLLLNADMTLRRQGSTESFKGVMYFASVDNDEIKHHNLTLLKSLNIPCWPDPGVLLELTDRHAVMKRCIEAGLVSHQVQQVFHQSEIAIEPPYVVKTGNLHQGQGKYLIANKNDRLTWSGLATVEPFFKGESCRVLFVGDSVFCMHFFNPLSWIKNSAGADVLVGTLPQEIIDHARKARDLFGLEVCGVDYVVSDKEFHFLEYNQFPGLDASDEIAQVAKTLFLSKMDEVEKRIK